MSNETKRDVFEDALRALEEFGEQGSSWEMAYDDLSARYSAASDDTTPDDMPVIPKDVSEWLTWCKRKHHLLKDALDGETRVSEDAFARAWLLGVWRVEGTGEIVKLEDVE